MTDAGKIYQIGEKTYTIGDPGPEKRCGCNGVCACTWSFREQRVEARIDPSCYVTSESVLICMGPRYLRDAAKTPDAVRPLGCIESFWVDGKAKTITMLHTVSNSSFNLFTRKDPFGIMLLAKNVGSGEVIGGTYYSNCLISDHSWGFKNGSIIFNEHITIGFDEETAINVVRRSAAPGDIDIKLYVEE